MDNNYYNNNSNNENENNDNSNNQSNNEYNQAQGSSYYTPPNSQGHSNYSNYSNNSGYYGYSNQNYYGYSQPQQKKFPKAAIALAALIVISVLLIVCLSLLTTFISKLDKASQSNSSSVTIGDEKIHIVQNSPQIEISKSTDSSYVPQSIPEVVSKIGNSVVEISTSSVVNDRFFHQYVTSGAGSGVIITQSQEAGYLLTNHHVIDSATEITVRLTNGEEYIAQLLGSDAELDLAVLRIAKKDSEVFTTAPIGDSSKLAVGQEVIAIGNPLGSLGGTVTDGIISALDRTVTIDNVSMVLLQHNAAINPGNSGGGLFDAMGNLIGIVNAKTSETGIEGLGFAIPVNIAYNYFNRVMVVEPSIGIQVKYGSVNRVNGLYVVVITDKNSKFELYDQIIAVNGQSVSSASDYYSIIESLSGGDSVTITVKRNYTNIDIKLTIE